MARKIFWGLWMTVWPAVALIPPLLTAQSPRHDPVPQAAIAKLERAATAADFEAPPAALVLEPPREAPNLGTTLRDPFETPSARSGKTTHRISQPRFEPADKVIDAEVFEQSEEFPPAAQEAPAVATPQGKRTQVRRPIPQLNEQEERAQKLIHERAMLRAKQRQDRLAAKHWGTHAAPRVIRRTTSWRPQLTQPNALAEFDRIEKP